MGSSWQLSWHASSAILAQGRRCQQAEKIFETTCFVGVLILKCMASVSMAVRTAGRDRRHHTREGCTGIEQSGDMNPQTLSDCAWCSVRLLLTADYVVGDAFRLTVVSSHRFLAPSGDTARRRSPACTNWAIDLELLITRLQCREVSTSVYAQIRHRSGRWTSRPKLPGSSWLASRCIAGHSSR